MVDVESKESGRSLGTNNGRDVDDSPPARGQVKMGLVEDEEEVVDIWGSAWASFKVGDRADRTGWDPMESLFCAQDSEPPLLAESTPQSGGMDIIALLGVLCAGE